MAEMGDLKGVLNKAGANVIANADRLVRRCALATDAAVVIATPVDTGRARANWQVELGQAASGVIGDPGNKKEAFDKSGQGAVSEGRKVIAGYKSGTSVNITNNLPYIERLNDGWSAQAPSGFVEKAVQVGINAVAAEAANIVGGQVKENP